MSWYKCLCTQQLSPSLALFSVVFALKTFKFRYFQIVKNNNTFTWTSAIYVYQYIFEDLENNKMEPYFWSLFNYYQGFFPIRFINWVRLSCHLFTGMLMIFWLYSFIIPFDTTIFLNLLNLFLNFRVLTFTYKVFHSFNIWFLTQNV